jgi:hypothetical protein
LGKGRICGEEKEVRFLRMGFKSVKSCSFECIQVEWDFTSVTCGAEFVPKHLGVASGAFSQIIREIG